MNNKYTEAQKQSVLELFANGEAVSAIVSTTGIPRSTLYSWIKASREKKNKKELSLRNFHYLENKVKRLEGIIEILQKVNCRATDSLDIKLNALEELHGQYNVHMLCEALKVPRGTFYNHILRNKRDNTWYAKRREENRAITQRIYDDSNQIFVVEKITAVMKSEGRRISSDMVLNHAKGVYVIRLKSGM